MAALSLPLGDVRAFAAGPAHLTVPLDQWGTVVFTLKGRSVAFTTADIFAILKGDKE